MSKKPLLIMFIISLLLNIFLIVRAIPLISGAGGYQNSPDKKFRASMSLLSNDNTLSGDSREYGKLTIEELGKGMLLEVTITPEQQGQYARDYDNITWAPDSKSVTFKSPRGIFQLNVPGSSETK